MTEVFATKVVEGTAYWTEIPWLDSADGSDVHRPIVPGALVTIRCSKRPPKAVCDCDDCVSPTTKVIVFGHNVEKISNGHAQDEHFLLKVLKSLLRINQATIAIEQVKLSIRFFFVCDDPACGKIGASILMRSFPWPTAGGRPVAPPRYARGIGTVANNKTIYGPTIEPPPGGWPHGGLGKGF